MWHGAGKVDQHPGIPSTPRAALLCSGVQWRMRSSRALHPLLARAPERLCAGGADAGGSGPFKRKGSLQLLPNKDPPEYYVSAEICRIFAKLGFGLLFLADPAVAWCRILPHALELWLQHGVSCSAASKLPHWLASTPGSPASPSAAGPPRQLAGWPTSRLSCLVVDLLELASFSPLLPSVLHASYLHQRAAVLQISYVHATPRHATPRHAMPRHVTPHHARPGHAMPDPTLP